MSLPQSCWSLAAILDRLFTTARSPRATGRQRPEGETRPEFRYHVGMRCRARAISLCTWVAVTGAGCASPKPASAPVVESAARAEPSTEVAEPRVAKPPASTSGADALAEPKGEMLSVDEARAYMVELINRDRKSMGLGPVKLDTGPPTRAGDRHAKDMATRGFLGHWGSDGSVPEQRHAESGGAHMVLENALCVTDGQERALDPKPRIAKKDVERAQSLFFNEKPPNDGHRKNILGSRHTAVGIGVTKTATTTSEIGVPCFTQEFVDVAGTYAPIPARAKAGARVHVAGELAGAWRPMGVGIKRLPAPRPLSPEELNKRRSYPVPEPDEIFFRKGYKTRKPLDVRGKKFSIDVVLPSGGPALVEISVWAAHGTSEELKMVSLRTIVLDR